MGKNIYYNPEAFGLEVFGEVELSEPSWSFDTVVLFRDQEGKWLWAHDSGCSCPSPFGDHTLADLETGGLVEFQEWVREFAWSEYSNYWMPQLIDLLLRARLAETTARDRTV